jgi:hypothetical protein
MTTDSDVLGKPGEVGLSRLEVSTALLGGRVCLSAGLGSKVVGSLGSLVL